MKKVNVHLHETLRKEHGKRSFSVRRGDKVKILRGAFEGSTGEITSVDRKKGLLTVEGLERVKADGSKIKAKIHASNAVIIEFNMEDSKREEALKR